eukprot:superscaffoldBa00000387_g4307
MCRGLPVPCLQPGPLQQRDGGGTNSVVLMALVDVDLRFIYMDVGISGRVSDGGVWNKSNIGTALQRGNL